MNANLTIGAVPLARNPLFSTSALIIY
jgi:hypothetical protein